MVLMDWVYNFMVSPMILIHLEALLCYRTWSFYVSVSSPGTTVVSYQARLIKFENEVTLDTSAQFQTSTQSP